MRLTYEDSSVDHSNNTVKFSSGTIDRTSGSEGPTHDPYGWEKWTVERDYKGKHVVAVLRQGIGLDLSINGEKVQGQSDDTLYELFERATGFHPVYMKKIFWQALARRRNKCRKCGSGNIIGFDGYLGETLYQCIDCKTILDSDMDMSTII